jgi:UDP-N-acetylglucosamine 4,6-dehydratase/5-epimerase
MDDFKGKTIMITGGTGSFGNAVTKKLTETNCAEIRIFSRDEKKQDDMRRLYNNDKLKFYIGDVRDISSLEGVVNSVDYVFHAAALKQVPSCEFFPIQAVKTNILGSENVIRSSVRAGVKNIVILSTDKAVMPVNAMGMTKALMEKVAQAEMRGAAQLNTIVSCVRYGNVMYSRGSVIPLFIKQIQSGLPLTVTDAAMTRFMLPLDQAVDLVLFALKNSKPGDIFVRKAPAATVGLLAEVLQKIFNNRTRIKYIGVRHGEKIHETLASAAELHRAEDLGDYYRISMDDRGINYEIYFNEGDQELSGDYNSENTVQLNAADLEELLILLPEIQAILKN